MSNESKEQMFYSRRPHHVGIVVKDIEKAIAHLEALGIGPFKFDDEHRTFDIKFKGELHGKPAEWTTRISNALMGDVELELLEPWRATRPSWRRWTPRARACTTSAG